MRPFSSLRLRLMLLVLITLLPALGLTLYTGFEQRRSAADDARKDALRVAHITAGDFDRLTEGANQLLHTLAQLPQARADQAGACNRLMADLLTQYPVYTNLGVADADGRVFCSSVPLPEPVGFADRDWFQQVVRTHAFAASDFLVGRITGKPIVTFAYPILDDSGVLQGVVWASFSLDWYNQRIADAALPAGSTLLIVDRKGTILARYPDPENWVGHTMPDSPLIAAITSSQEGTVDLPGLDGVQRLHAFVPLIASPAGNAASGASAQAAVIVGHVSVGIPTGVAYLGADRVMARNLVLLGLVTILATVAAGFSSHAWVLRHIATLLYVARRLASGELGARVGDLGAADEFNQLGRTLDQMAGGLELHAAELAAAAARAQALADSSRVLAEVGLDYQAVLQAIVRSTAEAVGDTCILRLVSADDETLRFVAFHHRDPQALELLAQCMAEVSAKIAGQRAVQVMKTGQVLRVTASDRAEMLAMSSLEYRPYLARYGIWSVLIVPLLIHGRIAGTLGLTRDAPGHAYTAEDEVFLCDLAGRAALALERAQLFQDLETELARRQEAEAALSQREASLREALVSLRASEERFRQLAENISEVFWLMDTESGNMLYVSPAYETVTGRTCESLYRDSESWTQVVHPDDRVSVDTALAELHGQPFDKEFRILRADGAVRWTRTRIFWLRDAQGQVYRIAGSTEDVTERREAIDKLARRAREMAALYETSLAINAQPDLPTLLRVILERTVELLDAPMGGLYLMQPDGETLELVVGMNLEFDYHGTRLKPGEGLSGRVAQTGEVMAVADYEAWTGRAGTYAGRGFRRVLGVPLKYRGRVIGVSTVTDNERGGAFDEEQVRLAGLFADQAAIAVENARLYASLETTNAELQIALHARDEMLQNVSHELRTPLTHTRGYSELLHEGILGAINEGQRSALAVILEKTESLKRLVTGLLTLQTFSAREIQLERLDAGEFLVGLVAGWRSVVASRYHLECQPPDVPACVHADLELLRQVFDQLLDNALKYSPVGGTLLLSGEVVGGAVQLSLSDMGTGIPADKLARIFERFFQIDGSTTRRKGGAGIGLALVQRIIEGHGGRVWAESPGHLGAGSTFVVELPLG